MENIIRLEIDDVHLNRPIQIVIWQSGIFFDEFIKEGSIEVKRVDFGVKLMWVWMPAPSCKGLGT